jgi:hypothetical protein
MGNGRVARWAANHFIGFSRREAWGYGVWFSFAAVVLGPELWAAFWKESAPFPTISATVASLEYDHPWVGLVVAGAIVACAYSSFRFPKTRTGVLQKKEPSGELTGETFGEDFVLPYRTPEGGRLTMSTTPVREVGAVLYFASVLAVILAATIVAALTTDFNDEFYVGRTLYGLILVFLVIVPNVLAWPKRLAVDIPFPTLFSTVRSLERRLRIVALLVVGGLVILVLHLVLYPWPSNIPDFSRLHRTYVCHPIQPAKNPLSSQQRVDCKRIDEADGKPDPGDP